MKMLPNVLLLEDNKFTSGLVKEVLSSLISELFITDNIYEASELASNQRIDLIISDIHLSKTQTSVPFLDVLEGYPGRVIIYSSDKYILNELTERYKDRNWLFLDKNLSYWIKTLKDFTSSYEPEQIG